jgi:LacI family transcriptional regulator
MRHPFRMRDIAAQSGLSEATVDRVLHRRGGVRESTVREVEQAIAELRRQETQVRLVGRTFIFDLVMQAPQRFSRAVRSALESELPSLRPAAVRSRFHVREHGSAADLVGVLDRVRRRGSHGVLLKAPDSPEVVAAVRRLVDAAIPVVTLVTDVPSSRRLAYVGVDNHAAGATAAYLMGQWLGDAPGAVLVLVSRSMFLGEKEREEGFRSVMAAEQPGRPLVEMPENDGLDETVAQQVDEALRRQGDVVGVYSIGGGNRGALEAARRSGRRFRAYIAHDLDDENDRLLRDHELSAVLHHDLGRDMRQACLMLLQAQGAVPGVPRTWPSDVYVVTPHNRPVGQPRIKASGRSWERGED